MENQVYKIFAIIDGAVSQDMSDVLGKTKEKINRIKYYLKYICSNVEFSICIS